MPAQFALTWNLTEIHGWGLVGVHTALTLLDQGRPPLLLEEPLLDTLRPANRERLAFLANGYRQFLGAIGQHPGADFHLAGFIVLHGLANGFQPGTQTSAHCRGERNLGVVAFEDTRLTADAIARAQSYDAMIVHSEFNRRLLADKGVADVRVALQGVDPTEIFPGPPKGRFGDRFVIFSGGKLEFRKGQDIALAAFRIFQQRHPEALLVTAWHSRWPQFAKGMAESPVCAIAPEIDSNNRLLATEWAVANGVPAEAFVDLGFLGRHQIAELLWDCHAAVFPNRCEGATNLVAMEAMACGVPVVLSANTGHLDILRADSVFPLTRQTPVPDRDGSRIDWGESSVDELVERLEAIYQDRAEAQRRGENAARFIAQERTWRKFAEVFIAEAERA